VQYLFQDQILDTDRRELTRGAERIALGLQVFDILVYLLRNREHVVSKDDLLDSVWNGRIVSESTLTSHINAARKVVGDGGEEQRLIRTVARKGFRFIGHVREQQTSYRENELAAQALIASSAVTLKPAPDLFRLLE
jgi:DNA-binding winged helix-turn-helix (wHTH) protein